MLTIQEVIMRLTSFWTERGAMLSQPFNTEVGAGTANPATTLRVLGPEPWSVAYVEPSVRPDDSRYGENPNRLQTHTQFQVILKPDPGDPQEVYLESLRAIGIDQEAHDIRFVEDNWASPALGAWGLGWEVWLDGLEITQFTYFQQAGSLTLDPVSVEITYGLERIVMALQGVSHFTEIQYAPDITYGEVFAQAEYEMSRFYLDEADVVRTRQLYDLHTAEARAMLERSLPLPAYYNVLKCSHLFNVLDARGAISTAERARAFGLMRGLSKQVAELWVARRDELGFPLGAIDALPPPEPLPVVEGTAPATLLFEIGVEELPPSEVSRARSWLADTVTDRLRDARLGHGALSTHATPRRLIVIVEAVEPQQQQSVETVRGPRVSAAFDADGAPTRAATGFGSRHGIDPADLPRITVDGIEYVAAVKVPDARGASAVLSGILSQVVLDLRSSRNMRWSDPVLTYSRPIRWLLALLGSTPIPVTASALTSGTTTRVHRAAPQPVVTVPSADGYVELLAQHGIAADPAVRRAMVVEAASRAATSAAGHIDLEADGAVVDEIVDLVEWPTPVLGSYDEKYLELPPEILEGVMRKHQRYLPVRGDDGLLPHFLTFANGTVDPTVVKEGNEAVIRARFEDALFFWKADLRVPPQRMREALNRLTFEASLGSMGARADRIGIVARALGTDLDMSADQRSTLDRASALVKFDLASKMVIEMTSLAGTMARRYAVEAGESPAVADALEGMEHPRTSDDAVASEPVGGVLALADRADLLMSLFAVGANPTGSSDPFALRRAALGLIATMRTVPGLAGLRMSTVLDAAARALNGQGAIEVTDQARTEVTAFIRGRYEQHLLDAGHTVDAVAAVLPLMDQVRRAGEVIVELEATAKLREFAHFVGTVQRVQRLAKDAPPTIDGEALTSAPELALLAAVQGLQTEPGLHDVRIGELPDVLAAVVAASNEFLDTVLVHAEDARERAARLGLLAEVGRLLDAVGIDWEAALRLAASHESR
ncbi:glycine--tRNA ligase [soil metagenome]